MSRPRAVYVRDLPESTAFGNPLLWCWKCHGEYSATRGDYFWMPPDRAFRCGRCRVLLQLATKATVIRRCLGRA